MELFMMREELSLQEKLEYRNILNGIGEILLRLNFLGQYQVISDLLNLLDKNEDMIFIKELNGVNMWGGADAVWEVGIQEKKDEITFINKLIELIDFMETTNVLGRGIKSIKRILSSIKQVT